MSQAHAPHSQISIAVAGGGIIGMSVAWRLAQQGFQVTVFDSSKIGGEASWAGAGMLAPGGEIDGPSALATLAIESRKLYPQYIQELESASGLSIDYQECGALEVAFSEADWLILQHRAERQAEAAIQSKLLDRAQITAFWPRLRTVDLVRAYFYPEDAIVNPREVLLALAVACRRLNVSILQDCPVLSAHFAPEHVLVTTCSGSHPFTVLINAAGAWSDSIAVHGLPPLPAAYPVKGHLIGYQQPDQTCSTIIRHGHTYLLQRANGLLIAGASVEHVGFDRNIEACISASLAQQAGFLLPHLTETTPTATWVGFRPGSDRLYLGSWHSNRFYLAYGHFRNGILLAPVTAQILSREISANWGKP